MAPLDMLFSAVLCLPIVSLVSAAEEMTAKAEQDVTLPCHAHSDASVTLLEWIRLDLAPDDYVFLYRNERSYEKYQHVSFRGRVALRDPAMTHGDVSVIVKNVSISDAGTYECQVTTGSAERASFPAITSVTLKVTHSGDTAGGEDGYVGLVVGLSVAAVLLVLLLIVTCLIIKKLRRHKRNQSYEPSAENECVT